METITEVLALKHDTPRITIESTEGDLVLVHYSNNATHSDDLKHRGTVVDVREKVTVAKSFGYTPVIVADKLERGIHTFKDTAGQTHELNMSNLKFRMGREGLVIKVFKHNGKVYLSSHKKVDVSRSNLGDSITFDKMYEKLGGPTEELFDKDALYSPFCHTFIVSHKDLLIASRINMMHVEGYLFYLGATRMWDKETWGGEKVNIEQEPKVPEGILESDYIPLDIANHHLKYGFHPDEPVSSNPLLWSGEYVIGYDQANDQWYRFESPSYHFRLNIREKDVNLRHGFYKHLTLTLKAGKKDAVQILDQYKQQFTAVAYVDPTSIYSSVRSKGYIVSWPRERQDALTTKNLVYNTWACYLLSCPLHLQVEAAGFYNDYYETCVQCYTRIFNIWDKTLKLSEPSFLKSGLEQIARKRIDDIIRQSQIHDAKNVTDNLSASKIFHSNCKNLISKEHGGTLFAINEYLNKYTSSISK